MNPALMSSSQENKDRHASHLFTVRLWVEELGDGRTEYRGKVRHVMSGARRYFRGWPVLEAFLKAVVRTPDGNTSRRHQKGSSRGE